MIATSSFPLHPPSMDDWHIEFWRGVDDAAKHLGGFVDQLSQDMIDAVDAIACFSEDVIEQVQISLPPEVEGFLSVYWQEWLNPIDQTWREIDTAIEEMGQPFHSAVDPVVNQHPTCIGCRHYHGQVYGDTMLVCGMHPYGVDDGIDTCADKEPVDWQTVFTFPNHYAHRHDDGNHP